MANDSGNNQPPSTAAAAVSQSPSSTPDSYIGSFISLTSKSEIRYEGVLDFLNTKDSSLGLKNVRSYGTEGRKKDGPQIPPNDKVFEFILFRGSDIKDLQVKSSPSPQVEESLDNDPAIIQSRYAGVSPSSSKSVSLNGGSFTEYGSYKGPASLNSVPPLHQSVNQTEYGASQATQSNMGSYAAPSYQQRYSEPASSHHAPQHSLPPSASHVMMQDLKQAYPLQGPEHFTSAVLPKSVAPVPVVTTANSLSLTSRQGLAPQQLPMAPTTNIGSPLLSVTSSMSSYAYTPAFPQSSQTVGNSGAPIFSRIGSNASPLYPVSPLVDSSSGVFPQQPPRLLTPDQLSLPSFSGQLYLDQNNTAVLSSEPQNPSLSFTTSAVQAPLLPLPPAAKKLQSSSEFTEEFDFVAMNEKFNKDEVWGYLGKAKQTAKKMEGVDIALVNEDKGNEVDHGLDSNADPKPAYNKDDFFDNISRNTVARGGGENTLHYAFPLLIIQTTLVVFLSRLLAFLLKPLHQPKVIAEILAGIMLGPSAFGRNKTFTNWIFPSWSTPILECVSNIGLLFFLFLVGLELDLNTIHKSGKKAIGIAFAGISLPFFFSIGVAFVLRKIIKRIDSVGYGEFFLFIGVSLSITAFPVLARILAELRLLTTQIGEMAMAAAAFNDVAAWILLALAVALARGGGVHHSPLISLWVFLSGIGFVIFMFLIIRPIMILVAKKSSNGNNNIVEETYLCLTLVGVMLFGFMTDFIGIHAIFGGFIFGLVIPKNGDFSEKLILRIEDFVSGLLLPLYFASSGIKTNISQIHSFRAWGLVVLVVSTACVGKVFGTFIVGIMLCSMPMREALALGVLMNTKGLVELIVLNIGKEKKVLDDETFAILVIMALFTTFITTPIVMAIHKPSSTQHPQIEKPQKKTKKQNNLRILACLRGPRDARALINLIESLRSYKNNNNYASITKLYVMRLVEFTDRLSSISMVQRARKNGFPFIGRVLFRDDATDQVGAAFEAYSTLGKVMVRPTMAISGLSDLHEDIIHVAEKKRVELIILPFDKYWQMEGNEEVEIHAGHGWRMANERVMSQARCSVAVVVDRGLQLVNNGMRICIVFFGGADCSKALEIGSRMVEHPAIRVTLVRFIHHGSTNFDEVERTLDDSTIAEFKMKWGKQIVYVEKEANNLVNEVLEIGKSGEFELMIIGNNKNKFPQGIMAKLFDEQQLNNSELGPLANLLASSDKGIKSSVLVIQHQQQAKFGNSKVASNLIDKDIV